MSPDPASEPGSRRPFGGRARNRSCTTLLLGLCLLCGCDGRTNTGNGLGGSSARRQTASQELQRGLQFLTGLDDFDRQQAVIQATAHFNRWLNRQEVEQDWQPDEMIATLPRAIREGKIVAELDDMRFRIEDVRGWMESLWARDVSDWVARRPRTEPLNAVLQAQLEGMEAYDAEQLLVADRLFDWTIRNIQQDELLAYPAEPLSGPGVGDESQTTRTRPAPQRAVPGPGYTLAPWEALLYGHGDALARARIFVLLARQQGIDVVMLALPGLTTPPRPRPWVAAALIGRQLYLFDTVLGLPIPGPDGAWVATLQQVLDDPALISSLDVGSEFAYRFDHDELRDIMALIDASPQALSREMWVVESKLTGDDSVVLTVQPSELAERLQQCEGISTVFLWTVPFETVWYREARQAQLEEDKEAAAREYLRVGLFDRRTSLARARYLHLRGQFDGRGEAPGAKGLYLSARVSQQQIDELEESPEVQRAFGLVRETNEREIAWRGRLALTKLMMATAKLHASYWLGLTHYETTNYEPSITWLRQRTLEATPDGPWTGGARYNLGRALEAAGQTEQAREVYLLDKSHQAHGNLLRASWLRRLQQGTATTGDS